MRTLHLAGPPVALACVIFFLSSQSISAPSTVVFADKFAHLAVFGLLGLLTARWVRGDSRYGGSGWCVVSIAVLLAGIFGVTDEVHQAFTPGREPDIVDAWCDLTGAVIGASAAVVLYRWWETMRRSLEVD